MSLGMISRTEVDLAGGNFQVEWETDISDESTLNVQAYYDRSLREDSFLGQQRTTWDLSFTHRFRLLDVHDIIWGGGYRYSRDHVDPGISGGMIPESRGDEVVNLFVQNEWTVFENRLHLIFGSKFEHNDYTGFEIQPTGRILWTPTDRHTLWAAVSRAVRTPSRADSDIIGNIGQGFDNVEIMTPLGPAAVPVLTILDLSGNRRFKSEELLAYEVGYRSQAARNLSVDLTLFFNAYDNLRTNDSGTPVINPHSDPVEMIFPVTIGNGMKGKAYGVELSGEWQVTDHWKLSASYSWLKIHLDHHDLDNDPLGEFDEESTPGHQASLFSYLDLPHGLEWDTSLYYFSSYYKTPSHLRCDMRVGWQTPSWEFSIKGENLFSSHHRESPNSMGWCPVICQGAGMLKSSTAFRNEMGRGY